MGKGNKSNKKFTRGAQEQIWAGKKKKKKNLWTWTQSTEIIHFKEQKEKHEEPCAQPQKMLVEILSGVPTQAQ